MTSNASGTGAWTLQQRNNARQGRALIQSLLLGASNNAPLSANRSGVISTASDGTYAYDFRVTVSSGLTMTVQPGSAFVNRPGQGPYDAWRIPAAVTVTCDAAPATNPRNDLVVLRIYDAALGDVVPAEGPVAIQVITGQPGATPVDPVTADATGTVTNWATAPVPSQAAGGGVGIILARAQVSTGGVITLTDLRRSTGLIGGVRVLLPGDLLSDPSFMPGDLSWYNGLRFWDGAAWNPLATEVGQARGILAQTFYTADGATGTAAEVMGDSTTFTVDVNRQYSFELQGAVVASAANPYMNVTFRIANGASASTSSPLIRTYLMPLWGSGKFDVARLVCPVKGSVLAGLGITSGTATVRWGAYIASGNGGGSWTFKGASDDYRQFLVRDEGINR